MNVFYAGAAKAKVKLGADCFPNSEYVGLHDDLYVRVAIFEADRRFALLSADMPSMFPEEVENCKVLLKKLAGVAPEYSWVTVSHSFSALHVWPVETEAAKLPPALASNTELIVTAKRINQAFREAYTEAICKAVDNLREASIGFGTGNCFVNVNRNMKTVDGWWQGANQNGFVDRMLSVVRVNDTSGDPIVFLYNYSVQSSVTAGKICPDGGKLVSADLPGAASAYIEKEYGETCPAIFMPGATGDQVPLYRINYYETDKEEKLRTGCLGEQGYILLAEQGRVLGNSVLEVARGITCDQTDFKIRTASVQYLCKCQKRENDLNRMHPSLNYTFVPDGEQILTVYAVVIDDIALVGLLPEMDGYTVAEIRNASPFKKTIVSALVNGNAKTMPRRKAYSQFLYTAMNSPFAEGSAELSRDTAIDLLKKIRAEP